MKVLVVDDNPVNQKLLFFSLKKYYEIETADNGLQAVQKLEDKSFDVVLMDLLMPVMDGAEATLRIRASENNNNKHIPIIFVTTNDFEHDRVRCMQNGGDAYLIKPVELKELLVSINFHINQKLSLMN